MSFDSIPLPLVLLATPGLVLLAFMLAFTFNAAATRHEARKALVIKETNAIETTCSGHHARAGSPRRS
jgi:hypothetical protein